MHHARNVRSQIEKVGRGGTVFRVAFRLVSRAMSRHLPTGSRIKRDELGTAYS